MICFAQFMYHRCALDVVSKWLGDTPPQGTPHARAPMIPARPSHQPRTITAVNTSRLASKELTTPILRAHYLLRAQ